MNIYSLNYAVHDIVVIAPQAKTGPYHGDMHKDMVKDMDFILCTLGII